MSFYSERLWSIEMRRETMIYCAVIGSCPPICVSVNEILIYCLSNSTTSFGFFCTARHRCLLCSKITENFMNEIKTIRYQFLLPSCLITYQFSFISFLYFSALDEFLFHFSCLIWSFYQAWSLKPHLWFRETLKQNIAKLLTLVTEIP